MQLVIYGAGGSARQRAWLASKCGFETVAMIDDDPETHGRLVNGIPIYGLEQARQAFPDALMINSIGSSKGRQITVEKAIAAGFEFANLIHPQVECAPTAKIGIGVVCEEGSILISNIVIGDHVQINFHCVVAHDVILENYVTLAPSVTISGWVHIHERAWLGAGCTIINGSPGRRLEIGMDAIIGAGACAIRDVPPREVVVGVPAKPIIRH